MAASTKFYPTNYMQAALVTSVTSWATGYPKENLLDNNPDTSWKGTSTADQVIKIDLGSAKNVDCILLRLRNYTTDFSAARLKLEHSTDDVTYTTQFTGVALANNTSRPYFKVGQTGGVFGTNNNRRYWQLTISSLPAVIELSQIILAYSAGYILAVANELPQALSETYYNRHEKGPGGRRFNAAINKHAVQIINRTYRINGTTNYGILLALFDAVQGGLLPCVIIDDADDATTRFVYIDSDTWQATEEAYQLYRITLNLVEVPYIAAGETY